MQILYLSNRPDVLAETIDYVTEHMPWIDDFVVIAPSAMVLEQWTKCRS